MDKVFFKKAVAIIAIIMLSLNLLFAGLGKYSITVFWIIIGIVGIASIAVMKLVK